MSYYDDCLKVQKEQFNIKTDVDNCSSLDTYDSLTAHETYPLVVSKKSSSWHNRGVFYITDLHLDEHLLNHYPDGASDVQVKEYIHKQVLKLFSGDFFASLRSFKNPVVLFGGDTSASYSISELFYADFISMWEEIVNDSFANCIKVIDPLRKEYEAVSSLIEEWENGQTKNKSRKMLSYREIEIPSKIKKLMQKKEDIDDLIYEKEESLGLTYRWEEDYKECQSKKYIYAILGNHELWDFDSYDSCFDAYDTLFKKLGICFVEGRCAWLGPHYVPITVAYDHKKGLEGRELLEDQDRLEFERQMQFLNNALIVGSLGFAARNNTFNAEQEIYGTAINRKEELERCNNWVRFVDKAKKASKRNHCPLIVLSHTPLSDWSEDIESYDNCFLFSGHTHRNYTYRGENNVFLFADNQIGYTNESFHFKKAELYLMRDPFAADPDGYRETNCSEYREYYLYVNESLPGTGTIERHIELYDAKLYVVKKNGYFAFFLSSSKGVYICNGGQIIKIGKSGSLDKYFENFMTVIQKYITLLSPLRRAQEYLSAYVKTFGGTGRIHGTIVDIDFEDHIMVNTVDGSLTFYNSPFFGTVKTYSDIKSLLHNHCPELEAKLIEKSDVKLIPRKVELISDTGGFEKIDIKNSPYTISRRINALQRLFDKHILRDWNSEFEEK